MGQGICRCGETYFGFEYQHELIGGELIKMSLEHVAAASEMEKVWLGDDPGNKARDRIIRTTVTLNDAGMCCTSRFIHTESLTELYSRVGVLRATMGCTISRSSVPTHSVNNVVDWTH